MPALTRQGDKCVGHPGSHGPRTQKPNQWSSDVKANGKGVVRINDKWADMHNPPFDEEQVVSASTKVKANGRWVVRIGDDISGSNEKVGQGSPNVFAG